MTAGNGWKMKKLQIYSTAMSVGCAIGVLMAVILTGNQNTLPRTAVVVPTKNPVSLQASTRSNLPSQLPFQRTQKRQPALIPDGIDKIITTSIPSNTHNHPRKNISDIASAKPKKINPFPGDTSSKLETITVRAGDTLFAIARRSGINAHKLAKLNAIEAPFVIRPGQILHLIASQ